MSARPFSSYIQHSWVNTAKCGLKITLSMCNNSSSTCGSRSKTSSPAPATCPSFRAWTRATSSMTGPRLVFTMKTPFLHCESVSAFNICRVCGVRGQCSEIMSGSAQISDNGTKRAPNSSSSSCGSGLRLAYMISTPHGFILLTTSSRQLTWIFRSIPFQSHPNLLSPESSLSSSISGPAHYAKYLTWHFYLSYPSPWQTPE